MARFAYDFTCFILGACLVSLPACAAITSYAVNDREARPARWPSDATIPLPERDPVAMNADWASTRRGSRERPALQRMADTEARKCGVPTGLFRRLIARESNWNPAAVSPSGAIGLGQLMPATAAMLGVDPWDAQQNLRGAACYLSMVKGSGTWREALMDYHGGPNRKQTTRAHHEYADSILEEGTK